VAASATHRAIDAVWRIESARADSRGDLLVRLGRLAQAREEFVRAADQCDNDPERELLLSRAVACGT